MVRGMNSGTKLSWVLVPGTSLTGPWENHLTCLSFSLPYLLNRDDSMYKRISSLNSQFLFAVVIFYKVAASTKLQNNCSPGWNTGLGS